MSDLSAADIETLRDLIDAVTPGLLPLSCDQASLSQMRMTGAPIEYVVADANGLEFATVRNQDEETTDLIVRAINALPALLDAAEKVAALRAAVIDERGARRMVADSADRFRDVITEVLDLPENPGDDALVERLRAVHGKTGPERHTWRDFMTGAVAHMENNGLRWATDAALNEEAGSGE